MDGRTMIELFADALDEADSAELFLRKKLAYEFLDQAAGNFCRDKEPLHKTVEITTVEDQQAYDLPPDFIRPYLKDRRGRLLARYYDGTNYFWPVLTEFEKIYRQNLTESRSEPGKFAIIDKEDKEDLITGTADAAGARANGLCTLQDDSMLFTTTNKVYPRDVIHNTTDGSDGYVITVTDATHLSCALFGENNADWSNSDAYVIQPAAEKQVYLDAPSESAGHTLALRYVCMPSPVYSPYGFWRLPAHVCRAIVFRAAAIYDGNEKHSKNVDRLNRLYTEELQLFHRDQCQQALQSGRYRERR